MGILPMIHGLEARATLTYSVVLNLDENGNVAKVRKGPGPSVEQSGAARLIRRPASKGL
jgi:hypothetical protein